MGGKYTGLGVVTGGSAFTVTAGAGLENVIRSFEIKDVEKFGILCREIKRDLWTWIIISFFLNYFL